MPSGRFVILWHQLAAAPRPADEPNASGGEAYGREASGRGDHYDWMFELDGRLLTWASQRLPPTDQNASVAASLLPPHRLAYLQYEGVVSGNRGTVQRIAAGQHRLLCCQSNRYEFAIQGDRCGIVAIYQTRSDRPSGSWVIEFEPNREARPTRVDAS